MIEESIELLGLGIATKLKTKQDSGLETIKQQAEELGSLVQDFSQEIPPDVGLKVLGGLAFFSNPFDVWKEFGDALLFIPKLLLTKIAGGVFLTITYGETTTFGEISFQSGIDTSPPTKNKLTQFEYPLTKNEWSSLIEKSQKMMENDHLQKVVLARSCKITTQNTVDIIVVLNNLKEKYPNCYTFLFQPFSELKFFGASPELLCQVKNNTIRTVALAGTTKRGMNSNMDNKLGHQLRADSKELAEHRLVIEDIQNKLKSLGYTIEYDVNPSLMKLKNVQHLKTEITGIGSKKHILELVNLLHPTAAMGGYPTDEALKFIKDNESLPRGYYAAPLGWFDLDGNGKFIVAIRSALNKGHVTWVYGGAGIMSTSSADKEWTEVELKFQPILEAMEVEL